jgi:hypothetical protein
MWDVVGIAVFAYGTPLAKPESGMAVMAIVVVASAAARAIMLISVVIKEKIAVASAFSL